MNRAFRMLVHSRAVVTVVLAGWSVVLTAQHDQPTYRAVVEAVALTVYVTGRDGNPVRNLTPDDFELLEAGVPQAISSFAVVDIPVEQSSQSLSATRDIEPEVVTNTGTEGRLYVVAIDEVPAAQALRIRHFLRPFFEEHFGPNDLAALVYLGRGQTRNTQGLTNNRRLLLEAVERVQPGFSAPDSLNTSGEEASWYRRVRMRALRELVESMAVIPGRRKALLYFTVGIGMDVFEVLDYTGGTKSSAFDDLHRAIAAATRGGVAIYPINPCGLDGGVRVSESPSGCDAGVDEPAELRALANATGGFAVVGTNEFAGAFARIVRENSTYYLLGFSSTDDRRDGRFRKLEVRVRHAGLNVRTRAGYLAPRGRAGAEDGRVTIPPAALAKALQSPLPDRSVPLRASAVPFRGPGRAANVALALELDGSSLGLIQQEGSFRGAIAMATLAVNANGGIHPGRRYEASLSLPPEKHQRALAGGVRILTEMQLPAGRYQLRLGAGSKERAGSVVFDLEVPDFTRGALVMSGVALTSVSARGGYTVPEVDRLGPLLGGPLTAAREFDAGDAVTVYAEVYENVQQNDHSVEMRVELRSDTGRVLRAHTQERSSSRLFGLSENSGFSADLLLDVEPGLYVIHVQARANVEDRHSVSRDVLIRVR